MPPSSRAAGLHSALPLLVQSGNRRWLFHGIALAGRHSQCMLPMPKADTFAEYVHAELAPGPDGWTIEDLDSMHGTWLNGTRVHGLVPLAKGDRLRIGRTILIVVPVEPAPPA